MSAVKRRRGETLTARIEINRHVQSLLRGIAYNRLVRLGFSF